MKDWQHVGPFPGLGRHWEVDPLWFVSAAMPEAVAKGRPVLHHVRSGAFVADTTVDGPDGIAVRIGLPLVYRATDKRSHVHYVFANEHGLVRIRHEHAAAMYERGVQIEFATTDVELHDRLLSLLDLVIVGFNFENGTVSALIQTDEGYQVRDVGVVGVALERSNYTAQVIEDFDHVIADFQTKAPCGRLVVLSGEPGSGKSFLVRGLISAMGRESRCVLVPPHLVQQLADPALLPALIGARNTDEQEYKGALILICEDGDHCLVQRGADNMSAVHGVLNTGDGLMGQMLDLRLVITTNAKKLDMDAAVSRDGRLCRRIDVDRLAVDHANHVLGHLVAGGRCFGEPVTLAAVYARARELGWKP